MNEMDRATDMCDKGLKDKPDDINLKMAKAKIYEKQRDYANAKKYYEQCFQVERKNILVLKGLANIYHRHSDGKLMSAASKCYELALDDPKGHDDVDLLWSYAELLETPGIVYN
eukprot:UN26853